MVPDKIEPAERVSGAPHDLAREPVGAQIADQRQRPPPDAVISPTTASTPAWSISATPTAAPSRAKRSAPARPMPDAAAVTMPILFSSRMMVLRDVAQGEFSGSLASAGDRPPAQAGGEIPR